MKCTYRLLILSVAILFVLIMIGAVGDVSRLFDLGFRTNLVPAQGKLGSSPLTPNQRPLSLSISSRTIKRNDGDKNTPKLLVQENYTKAERSNTVREQLGRSASSDPKMLSGKPIHRMVIAVVCCGDRLNETQIMLKSAAALSQSLLKFIIFTEDNMKPVFKNMVLSWPAAVQERISLELHSITFPPGQDAATWRNLFKPCASQRLFIPSLLVNEDALLYVDTDVVFLSPVEEVWRHFHAMNASHMAAVAPESEDLATGWYNRFAKHPYYGRLGVNSGVMLMNLTRLRQFGWEEYVVPIYQHYRLAIRWGDQDIINIIFHFHPDKLYVFGCEYNFRSDHCMYMSVCSGAEKRGIFVLHGSRDTFHNKKQPAFRAVYQAWNEYELGQDLRQNLYYPMQRFLLKATSTNCGKLHSAYLKVMGSLVQLR